MEDNNFYMQLQLNVNSRQETGLKILCGRQLYSEMLIRIIIDIGAVYKDNT